MNPQRGKSTVTAVVVILILVVIAAVAIPAWQHHKISQRVETALSAAGAAKLVVMEAAVVHGGLSHIKSSDVGYDSAALANPYVAKVSIADGGLITLVTKGTGADPDLQLLLIPTQGSGAQDATIAWGCTVLAGDADRAPAPCHAGNVPAPAASTPTAADSVSVSPAHSS